MAPEDEGQPDEDKFWDALGDPQVLMLEALWWIGEPLSPIGLVDVLDGHVTMGEAADCLEFLQGLGMVEPAPIDPSSKQSHDLAWDTESPWTRNVPYRLRTSVSRVD